ncbi:hypothetical protein [Spirosoma sp.]|uniref:hypothetical protein n=1 Tax=Spirosoma sp. TaxID=1899569 RepID=UPI002636A784|nr:hypothetical protein [Spirosoma sp.]MCX6217635.1 hypothetical protein [Spirosoma sp.]
MSQTKVILIAPNGEQVNVMMPSLPRPGDLLSVESATFMPPDNNSKQQARWSLIVFAVVSVKWLIISEGNDAIAEVRLRISDTKLPA